MLRMLRSPFLLHVAAGIGTLLVLSALTAPMLSSDQKPSAQVASQAAIVIVDHNNPLTLSVAVTISKDRMLADFDHVGDEEVSFTLPAHWQRTEVRGTTLEDLRAEAAAFGTRRYTIPAKAGISFVSPTPVGLLLRNPSSVPIKIQWSGVNLDEEHVMKDTILLQDGEARLW